MTTQRYERTRDNYLISSDPSLLSLPAINAAFASQDMYWCQTLPESVLRTTLENSFCLGLYIQTATSTIPTNTTPPRPEQIGLARMVTDYTTFVYLTDVYVKPEEQGKGLGTWLVQCVNEVLGGMGHLRRACLIAGERKGEGYYESTLGMRRVVQGKKGIVFMDRLGPEGDWVREDAH